MKKSDDKHRVKVNTRKLLVLAVFGALVLFAVTAVALIWDGLADNLGHADVGVVLGTAVQAGGSPSARLQARLDKAIALYARQFFARVIVSGGIDPQGHDEAEVMKAYLVSKGIPAESIVSDNSGATTYDTGRFVSEYLAHHKFQTALVITQYYHISRSRLTLRRFGVEAVLTAHADFFGWRDLYSVPREVFGLYYYLLRPC